MAPERSSHLNQEPTWVSAIAQPTIDSGGRASLVCSTTIAATPETCMQVVLDTSAYPEWNSWIPEASIRSPSSPDIITSSPATLAHLASKPQAMLLLGTKFTFRTRLDPDSPRSSIHTTDLVVSLLEGFKVEGRSGLRVSWKSPGGPWLLRAERTRNSWRLLMGAPKERAEVLSKAGI